MKGRDSLGLEGTVVANNQKITRRYERCVQSVWQEGLYTSPYRLITVAQMKYRLFVPDSPEERSATTFEHWMCLYKYIVKN